MTAWPLPTWDIPVERKSPPELYPEGLFDSMAGWTGLEPAASGVTGRRSNQLSYARACGRLKPVAEMWL